MLRGKNTVIAVSILGALAALAFGAGIAHAVFPDDSVTSFAACLATNAGSGGTFTHVAVGDTPTAACNAGQILVHLSGGDITSVDAGTGLTGGSANGAATLGIGQTYALPQSCADGNVPKWLAPSSRWGCAADSNSGGTITGVTAAAGLTGGGTSGAVSLALSSGYQLPQGCSGGQIAKADGAGSWSCSEDNTGASAAGLHVYYTHVHEDLSTFHHVEFGHFPAVAVLSTLDLPAGTYLLRAHVNVYFLSPLPFASRGFVDCELDGPSGVLDSNSTEQDGNFLSELLLDGTVTLASPGLVQLGCDYENDTPLDPGRGDSVFPWDRSITAIPVSDVN